MKKFLIIAALFIVLPFYSQKWWNRESIKGNGNVVKQERKTSNYEGIVVSGSFKVSLVDGKEGNIIIQGDENILEYVIVDVKSDELNIHFKRGFNLNLNKRIEVTVPVESISNVALSGSGNITSLTEIKSEDFEATQSGSGSINLLIESTSIETQLSGSGHIELKGQTKKLNSTVSGSGYIDCKELLASNVQSVVSGSGRITISAKDNLDAVVSGSGRIEYNGEPKKINESVSGSGRIYKI